MRVTNDKYELPLAVGDSWADIARLIGLNTHSIYTALSDQKTHPHRKRRTKFLKVEVEDV